MGNPFDKLGKIAPVLNVGQRTEVMIATMTELEAKFGELSDKELYDHARATVGPIQSAKLKLATTSNLISVLVATKDGIHQAVLHTDGLSADNIRAIVEEGFYTVALAAEELDRRIPVPT